VLLLCPCRTLRLTLASVLLLYPCRTLRLTLSLVLLLSLSNVPFDPLLGSSA
jgi:hypothetical protein